MEIGLLDSAEHGSEIELFDSVLPTSRVRIKDFVEKPYGLLLCADGLNLACFVVAGDIEQAIGL